MGFFLVLIHRLWTRMRNFFRSFSARVRCRSLWRSVPSGFLPRSFFQLMVNFARSTPAVVR